MKQVGIRPFKLLNMKMLKLFWECNLKNNTDADSSLLINSLKS